MIYYRFKTFTTSYYFPKLKTYQQYMYGLYSSYGGFLSKIYWLFFKKSAFIRSLTSLRQDQLPLPFQQIKESLGLNTLLAFNMGSPGIEQKISILGYDNELKQPFFAKFSQKEAAKALTINEIKIYQLLDNTRLTPKLLHYQITDEYVCLKAEYIQGERPKNRQLNQQIVDLCLKLKDYHIENKNKDNLKYSLSHGDFCPWNMLVSNGYISLIDWELAKERPLGYDLFTFICQVSNLFEPEKNLLRTIDQNISFIQCYFKQCDIPDYLPYLKAFAQEKAEYEKTKNNIQLYNKYHQLEQSL